MAKEIKELYFQWKKSELYGTVETVEREITLGDIDYYVFKSGRQINKTVVYEYMVQLESPTATVVDMNHNPYEEDQQKKKNAILEYPTLEEIKQQQNNDGVANLGKAIAIPHPDDIEKVQLFNQEVQKTAKKQDHIVRSKETYTNDNSYINDNINMTKSKSPVYEIINKAKKEEFELTLSIKVKLPVKHFFDILDEDFVENNKNDILTELINKIKHEDLDSQLRSNLINIYNIKENVQQETTETDS